MSRSVTVVATLALVGAPSLHAQAVRGVAVQPDSAPARGAFVALVDGSGQAVARAMVRAGGQFDLAAPGAGRYSLVLERSGFMQSFPVVVDVAPGSAVMTRVVADGEPLGLTGLRPEGQGASCAPALATSGAVQKLWNAARVDLMRVSLSESSRLVRREIVSTEREYDADGRKLRSEHARTPVRTDERAIFALTPDSIAHGGYLLGDSTYFVFEVPDARLLLSDGFQRTHCLAMAPRDRVVDGAAQLGLTFVPIGVPKGLTDIEGTFWFDRGTSALAEVEWRYAPSPAKRGGAYGGSQVLATTAEGYAYLSRWAHRYPVFLMKAVNENRARATTSNELRNEFALLMEVGTVREDAATAAPLSAK